MSSILDVSRIVAGHGRSTVLNDVSLQLAEREVVCLLGANGAGKSTLLAAISGLLRLSSGSISFAGKTISGLNPSSIVTLGLAQVPERRQLFGGMTVEENLQLGAFTVSSQTSIRDSLKRCYGLFPRLAERRNQMAGSMSGGEQQMLAIGRALMCRPRALLLDEPTLGLAPKFVELVLDLVQRLRREGTAVLIVEQNAHAALQVSDRGYVLATGRITREGPAASLLTDDTIRAAYLGDHQEGGTIEARLRHLRDAMRNSTAPPELRGAT